MGIYDRGYYDGDQWKGDGSGGGPGSSGRRSIVAVIIMINVAVFLVDMFSPKAKFTEVLPDGQTQVVEGKQQQISASLALKHKLAENGYPGPLENPLYIYQIFTYGFAHASIGEDSGLMHIAFNMLALFFLGRPVEQRYGREEFLRFYILSLLFAGVVWLACMAITGAHSMAVGASGAVVAVVMLFVFNYPRQTLLLMGVIPMPAWLLGVLVIGMDVMNSFNSESRIAVQAHLAGAAFAAMYFYGKWKFDWLKFDWLTNRLSGKPRLKVHSPDEEPSPELSRQADIILDKVHRLGEESLTRKERKTLERYSKTVRKNRHS